MHSRRKRKGKERKGVHQNLAVNSSREKESSLLRCCYCKEWLILPPMMLLQVQVLVLPLLLFLFLLQQIFLPNTVVAATATAIVSTILPLFLLLLSPQWTSSTGTAAAAAGCYDVFEEGVQAGLYVVIVYYGH